MQDSIVDGTGMRAVVFFAGCPHKCKGCHNPESWNYDYGDDYTVDEIVGIVESNRITRGVTLSGGDPFFQPLEAKSLAGELRRKGYNMWAYSGYTFEEILLDHDMRLLLQELDVLVDGRFNEELKDLTLRFRGSSNQRIIDVQESLRQKEVVIHMA